MVVTINNGNLTFANYSGNRPIGEVLAGVYGNFNNNAFSAFLTAIGGTEGTIWSKIQRLYMPLFSNGSDNSLFFDVKSLSVKAYSGYNVSDISAAWTFASDANHSNLKGYKGVKISDNSGNLAIPLEGVTNKNVCVFSINTYDELPGSAMNITEVREVGEEGASLHTATVRSTTAVLRVIDNADSTYYGSATKSTQGFNVTDCCVQFNDGTNTGIKSNRGNSSKANEYTECTLGAFYLACRHQFNHDSFSRLVSLQGVAKGLTESEAQTLETALEGLVAAYT